MPDSEMSGVATATVANSAKGGHMLVFNVAAVAEIAVARPAPAGRIDVSSVALG